MRRSPKTPKINHAVLAKTLHLLQQGPVSAYSLSGHTDVTVQTAYNWLRELHRHKTVHISMWMKDILGRERIPVFSLGKGDDVPRKTIPREEVLRRYKERQDARKKC